jgi:nucleoside-diphosphate kinase
MWRTIVGEIISRFERAGLHLVGMKLVQANDDLLVGHYEGIGKLGTRKWKAVLDSVVNMMKQSPVLAMVWEGVEVVDFVRKIVGSTEPKSALPGTIRGDFAHMSYGYLDTNPDANLFNLVHASADLDEAKLEIPHWFKPEEIMSHKPHNGKFVR